MQRILRDLASIRGTRLRLSKLIIIIVIKRLERKTRAVRESRGEERAKGGAEKEDHPSSVGTISARRKRMKR